MNLMIPTNIARLESLAKDIYEYKSQVGFESVANTQEEDLVLKEPVPMNYGIDFLDLFLEIQTMLSMLNSLPDPAIYELALQKTSHPAEHCVYVDDKPRMLEPARVLGISVIAFENPDQLERDLQGLGLTF